MNDTGWITNLVFLVDVNGHLNHFNKQLLAYQQDARTTILWPLTSSFDCGKTNWNYIIFFTFHTWSILTLFIPSVFRNIPSLFFALQRVRQTIPGFQNYAVTYVVCFTFEGRYWEGSRKFANNINLKCDTYLKQKFCKNKFSRLFYFLLLKGTFPVLRSFDLRMTATFSSTYVCEQFFCLPAYSVAEVRFVQLIAW
jgi:hypothetical protein